MAGNDNAVKVLLRLPVFRRLWAAVACSSFGDWLGLLATTALAAYLTKDTSSLAQGAAISGVLLTRLAPDLILGPIAGALVDRFDRRKVAVIGDTLAAALYLSIAVAGSLTWLLVAQFLVEAVGLFANPAKQAMWVNIVPRERLATANQLNYVSIYGMVPVAAVAFTVLSTVAKFFGAPEAAGAADSTALITGATSAVAINIALVVDAGTYLIAAGTVVLSRRMIPAFTGDRSTATGIFSLIREGVSFVAHHRVMRAIYIGILGAFGAGGLVAGVAQAYVATLGAGNAGYGILFGAVFTGLALGMLVGPKVLPTVPRRVIFSSGIGAAGVMLIVMAVMPDFVGAAITSSVMGLFAGIAWITGFTMIGHEVSDHLRGRVFSFVMSSVRITLLATIAVAPVVAGALSSHVLSLGRFSWELTGPAVVLAVGGALALFVGLLAGHQVGRGRRKGALKRVLRRRSLDWWQADEHDGVLIAVEGPDASLVERASGAVVRHIRDSGYEARHHIIPPPQGPQPQGPHLEGLHSQGPHLAGLHPQRRHAGGSYADPGTPSPPADGNAIDETPDALRAITALSQAVGSDILPALAGGGVVVCSGYIDAVVVRFGGLGDQDEEQVLTTARWACGDLRPDLTLLVLPASPADDPAGQAYAERAGTAPERYYTTTLPSPADGAALLTMETSERIDALLRKRQPLTTTLMGVKA